MGLCIPDEPQNLPVNPPLSLESTGREKIVSSLVSFFLSRCRRLSPLPSLRLPPSAALHQTVAVFQLASVRRLASNLRSLLIRLRPPPRLGLSPSSGSSPFAAPPSTVAVCRSASVRRLASSPRRHLLYIAAGKSKLLGLSELKLKEAILKEPTLLIVVVGVPNVGKSALINSIHRIATSRFPVLDWNKRATVGPLPGVTQDIAGYKIASQPSIDVLDTPGVLVPSIPDMETGLKLALTGAVKDSVVGEERIAKYLLSLLNIRKTPLHWERLLHRREEFGDEACSSTEKDSKGSLPRRRRLNKSDALYVQDLVMEVQRSLCNTFLDFAGNTDEESDLESLIDMQLTSLHKVFRIPHKPFDETHGPTSKKLLTIFRSGKLGPFILDDLPDKQ